MNNKCDVLVTTVNAWNESIPPRTSRLTAGQIEEGAVNGWNPEVGGAGVKQHGEGLRRGTDADCTIVLSLRGHKH